MINLKSMMVDSSSFEEVVTKGYVTVYQEVARVSACIATFSYHSS